jgi:hypothetical protein
VLIYPTVGGCAACGARKLSSAYRGREPKMLGHYVVMDYFREAQAPRPPTRGGAPRS